MKKSTYGILSFLCAGAFCAGIATLPVKAESTTISNKDFFTAKGATMSASETASGVQLSLANVSKAQTCQDVASIYYNNLIDVSDLAKGITLLNSSATATREFDFMSIILRDSEDPTQVMTLHLQYAAWSGTAIETASLGLWDEFSYASTGKQSYVYDGEMTSGAAATREWMAYADGRYVYQNGSDGCLRLGNPAKILWGKDGEVVPFTFTYSNSVMKISSHNRTVADLTDAKYFEKAIANVSESEQPDLYDNLNEEYAANLFLSNKVTMELQFGNVKDGEFDICVQKIGGLNLQTGVENNYQSTSSSGVTYTGTALPITSEMIKLPGKYSAADIEKGFMFQVLPTVISSQAADSVRVVFRDSEDPTKAVTAGITTGDWWGTKRTAAIYKEGVWSRTATWKWSDGTTTASIGDSNDLNASAQNELGVIDFGNATHHGFFSADGTNKTNTCALKVAYNGTTMSHNTRKVAGSVTAETILTSGYATVELQFTVKNGGKVNLISVGDTSLANINMSGADTIEDNMGPTVAPNAYFDEENGAFVFEQGKSYLWNELKNEIVVVSDYFDANPLFTVEAYNAQHVKYEGDTIVFGEGDYFKIIATDKAGNTTTITKNIEIYSLGILTKYYVEISDQAVQYAVLTDLPSGYGYTIALYESSDTQYQNPLTQESFYLFTDVGEYKIKLTIYDSGMSETVYYADLEVTDKVAPTMHFNESYKVGYSVNEKVEIIMPTLVDNNVNGNPTLQVKGYFGETEVPIVDGYITLTQEGSYVIEYTAQDKSGNIFVEKKIIVNTGKDELAPEMTFAKSYKNSYKVNEKISLIMPTVSDNVDTSLTIAVEVVLNGEVLSVKNNAINPKEAGILTIVYFVEDKAGNQTTQIFTMEIIAASESGGCNGSLSGGAGSLTCMLGALGVLVAKRKRNGGLDSESKN